MAKGRKATEDKIKAKKSEATLLHHKGAMFEHQQWVEVGGSAVCGLLPLETPR